MSMYMRFSRTVTPAAILVAIAGCGGGDAPAGGGGGDAPAEMPFDVATAGNVSGSVMFEGTAPPPEVLDMASEADCAATYSGDPTVSWVNVDGGGGLQDVFVYVKEGLEGMSFPTPSDAVVIDQRGCQYVPLVSGVQIGQSLTFRNSDGLLHNINASPTANRPFNVSQPVNMETEREFAAAEVMVPIQCDVHGWMAGYIGVLPHPYHAVSGSGGSFNLSQLPPGDYVIEAWHSRLGTQEQTVTVTTGQTAEVTYTYTEAMLSSAEPTGDSVDPHDHGSFETLVGE